MRDETATASIVLSGTVRAEAGARTRAQLGGAGAGRRRRAGPALQNAHSFSFDVIVDYLLTGPESRSGSQVVTSAPA